MLNYDSDDADIIAGEMTAEKTGVISIMFTRAVRDAKKRSVHTRR